MKRILIFLSLFTLIGCTTHGKLKIYNKTNHNIYYSIKDYSGILIANDNLSLSLSSGKSYLVNEAEKKYKIYLEGETFSIYSSQGEPITETEVLVSAGKTTKIYANPTNACLKILNNSNNSIFDVSYIKIYPDTIMKPVLLAYEIPDDTIWFKQIPYSCDADSFNLKFFYFKTPPDTIFTKEINLKLDELFLLEIN